MILQIKISVYIKHSHKIPLWKISSGQNLNSFYLFLHNKSDKSNLNGLIWMLTLGHICCSFAFVLVSFILIQGWRVESTLSMTLYTYYNQFYSLTIKVMKILLLFI